jgi:cell division protein FtsN
MGSAPLKTLPRAAAPTTAAAAPGGFTIQVGSFGAPANAQKLQADMQKHFDDVRLVEAMVSGKTYYRVRIGSFADEQSAEEFARERVSSLGLSYKILSE